jgi:ABC-type bacteriocin/lantibiotic exporter with double-glycine peptidase domain
MKLFEIIRLRYYFSSFGIRCLTLGLEIIFVLVFIPKLTNATPVFQLPGYLLGAMVALYVIGIYLGDLLYFKSIRLMIKDLKLSALKTIGVLSHTDLNLLHKSKVTHYLEHETNLIAKGVVRTQDLIIDSLLVIAHIVVISTLSLNYILMTVGITSIMIIAGFIIRPLLKRDQILLSEQSAHTSTQLMFNIKAAERIKHEGMWPSQLEKLKVDLDLKFKMEVASHSIRLKMAVVFYFLAIIYVILITNYVGSKGLTVLGLSALTIFIRLSPRLLNVQKYLNSYQTARNLYSEFSAYIQNFVPETERTQPFNVSKIHFHNFNIKFDGIRIFEENLNFMIEGPGFFGVIGESGSGKSLLADCLAGFKLPDEGEILLNQKSAQNNHETYHVSSFSPLYSSSLLENIVLKNSYSEEKYNEVLETCDLSALKLSLGQQLLEPQRISLGERQRVIMARAIYQAPSCIILDESLSSLDFLREGKILNFLKAHSETNIVIHISHQLDSIRNAKLIFLLQDGKCSQGTWDEHASKPESLIARYEQRHK